MIGYGDALAWGPALPLIRSRGRILPTLSYDHAAHDDDGLRALLAVEPRAIGVGVVCDVAGLVVIDVDHPSKGHGDGAQTMRELQRRLGRLPPTRTHGTKSGGWQLVFNAPETPIRSAQRMLRGAEIEAPGVDVVAGHALLRWPPTSGYTVVRCVPAARLPSAWVHALADRPEVPQARTELACADRYARVALERSCAELASLASGRNVALVRVSYSLGGLSPPLDADDVMAALVSACEANGSWREHGSRACLGTIRRGMTAGKTKPMRLVSGL